MSERAKIIVKRLNLTPAQEKKAEISALKEFKSLVPWNDVKNTSTRKI